MMNNYDEWVAFWKNNTITSYREKIWRLSLKHFIDSTSKIINFNKDDTVLDIGSGPGYLADILAAKVKSYTGLDICDDFVENGKRRFVSNRNIKFYLLNHNNYTDLSVVQTKRFNIIICLSVIQYYQKRDDLRLLIKEVKKIVNKNAKMLIADIPQYLNQKMEVIGLLDVSIRNWCILAFLQYIIMMRFSKYYRAKSTRDILTYKKDYLLNILYEEKLSGKIITEQLTTNKGRVHLLIEF